MQLPIVLLLSLSNLLAGKFYLVETDGKGSQRRKTTADEYSINDDNDIETKSSDIKSDVQKIHISKSMSSDYDSKQTTRVNLAGKNNEIAEVHPRPILFSKNTRVTECSKKGCIVRKVSKHQKEKL